MQWRKPRRRLLALAVALVVIGSTTAWLLLRSEETSAATMTATVSRQTFEETVSASGTLAPAAQADLSFTVSGTVESVKVSLGDTVKAGDVLATLDDSLLASQVSARTSTLTAAKAKLAESSGSSSAQRAADQASVAQAQSALAQAKASQEAATLVATMDGTIAALDLEVGDVVGSSGGQGSGQGSGTSSAQVTLVSPAAFVVSAQVATSDIAKVTVGLAARVTPTGSRDVIEGTVSSVGTIATAQNNGTAAFPIEVTLTGDQSALYSGTSATVEIIVSEVADVLTVPSQAIRQEDGQAVVSRMVDGRVEVTAVEIGTTYGAQTEIVSGLAEGDEVQLAVLSGRSGQGGQGGQRGQDDREGMPSPDDFSGDFGGFPGGEMPSGGQGGPPNMSGGFPGGSQGRS